MTRDVRTGATGLLARYEAGEHVEVWNELRALGPGVREPRVEAEARAVARATMKTFGENVALIVETLESGKYQFAAKKSVLPARADVREELDALAEIAGPLPIVIEAFYEAFDGVSLAQDVDAMIDDSPLFSDGLLDELGRCDPLIVADLAFVVGDARDQSSRGATPVRLYVAPDPQCKGTIDDEIPDEDPVRTTASSGMDAELAGGASGSFVEWLRSYVAHGGFLGSMSEADRAHLRAGLKPF